MGRRLGYKGVQIPTFDGRLFDVDKAYESDTYLDEVKGICADAGVRSPNCPPTCRASWSP